MQPPWKASQAGNMVAEVQRLRDQLERECAETDEVLEPYKLKIETITQENKKLQTKLMRSQLRDSAKDSEVAVVKQEVLEKTAAIEKVMRDLQQQQQATLARVMSKATAMVSACKVPSDERTDVRPASPREAFQPAAPVYRAGPPSAAPSVRSRASRPDPAPDALRVAAAFPNGRTPSAASSPSRKADARKATGKQHESPSPLNESRLSDHDADDADEHKWFQSVKENLEHFGNVEVFMDSSKRDCSCCLEPMGTPYGIRPRKCQHVFHIECLLQWWTEGTCPVCSTSFAPDPERMGEPLGRSSNTPTRGASDSGLSRGRGKRSILAQPAGVPGPGTFGG